MAENNKFIAFFKDPDEGPGMARQRWAGSATFIMAAIGSAIGLGNFWRFPYLCYKWGGGLFFVPYLFALFFLGLPMMMLELSLGQLFQRGDIGVFRGIYPRLYGVGLSSVFSAFAINIFYTYLIAIACCYMFASFTPTLPWSIQRTKAYQDVWCMSKDVDGKSVMWDKQFNQVCQPLQDCDPNEMYITEEWFAKDLVRTYTIVGGGCEPFDTSKVIAGGDTPTEFSWQIMLALLLTWAITYFCVFKGVKSSSYIVWFTVPGPVIFVFIMVLNGLCLPNADEGIRMYLRGEIDGKAPDVALKLSDAQMWADAVGQIFFSLGVCMGVMTSYSSYNRRNKPIIRDVMIISFGNCCFSFFAGFAVFSIVGYLKWLGSPVAKKTSSTGLAFVAYPAAAETLPGSNFWTFILGLTLFTLGIDTAFSLVEAVSTVIYDTEGGKKIPRKLTALVICCLGWAFSLLFCSSWGFTYFDVIDRYISVYLMFILGMGQCAAAAWFFRAENVFADARTKVPAMVITIWYCVGTLIMGPVTVFCFPRHLMWVGGLIFWVVLLLCVLVSFLLKKELTCEEWTKEVLFYGAYELASMVASRSDENTSKKTKWWTNIFIAWWGFSIKYFIPWCLWTLMMWNFKADMTMDVNGKGYGGYHLFWQIMGFVYPFIGLLCFFIPICIVTTKEEGFDTSKEAFEKEEHPDHQAIQEASSKAIVAAADLQTLNEEVAAKTVDAPAS